MDQVDQQEKEAPVIETATYRGAEITFLPEGIFVSIDNQREKVVDLADAKRVIDSVRAGK